MTTLTEKLNTEELATLCGVHRRTVWDWAKRGVIPQPEKLGGVSRHDLVVVLAAIKKHGLKVGPNAMFLIGQLNITPEKQQ
jgi:predicted DNA-binding transcriptional regulator AlpA